MKGYVAKKGNRWYAVIYQGLDPVTGRERMTWHAAGTSRGDAAKLATRLAAKCNGRNDEARSLTFSDYLVRQWLPGKRLVLATSTYAGYQRNVERHVLPTLGRIGLRRLGPQHLESLYESLLHPLDGSAGLVPKTVYEIHLVIRGALADAVRRGLVPRNVALVARSPRRCSANCRRASADNPAGADTVSLCSSVTVCPSRPDAARDPACQARPVTPLI